MVKVISIRELGKNEHNQESTTAGESLGPAWTEDEL